MKNRTIIVGAIAAAIVLGVGAGVIGYVATRPQTTPTAAPRSAARSSAPVEPFSSPTPTPSSTVDTADAKQFATTIAGLFCRPDINQQVWYAALRPYFTADAAAQFSTTDPANVPCSRIAGAAEPVGDQQTDLQAAYQVPTDATSITVSLTRNSAQQPWQVSYVIVNSS